MHIDINVGMFYSELIMFEWEDGLDRKFHQAKGFYVAIIPATMVGLGWCL